MSNNLDLENEIRKTGEKVGDYFWPLPLWEEYLENMKSKVADISNLSDVKWGGTITAGIFLQEFVKDLDSVKWAHLDICSRMDSISSDVLEPGSPGEPVRMLVEFVRNGKDS
jgi:leucyl aminopeptidase